VAGAGADGPVSADPPETVRPLDPAKKVAATQEKVVAIRKKVAALKISCGGLFTHFDRHTLTAIPDLITRSIPVFLLFITSKSHSDTKA